MIAGAQSAAAAALVALLAFAAAAAPRNFEVTIAAGQVAAPMRVIKVAQGDRVRLLFTSDKAMSLHLHGYDVEVEVKPGAAAELIFEAYAAGRYAIEEHGQGGAHAAEPLLRVEVYPR